MSHAATILELQSTTLSSLTRPQLQCYCTRLGLQSTGRKSVLVARLQQAISGASGAATTSTITQTTAVLSVSHTTVSVVTTTQSTTSLPALLGNLGPPDATAWLNSIAQQAAQAAINQALSITPSLPGLTPGGMNTCPTYTPQFGLPTPATTSVNTTTSHSLMAGQITSAMTNNQTPLYMAPSISLTQYMQQMQQSALATPPSTAVVTLLPPTMVNQQPPLPPGASAALTGFHLPGELSGMLPHNTIQKILTLQFFDLSNLLPSNTALLHDPQPIHLQVGGDTGLQLVLSRRPTQKKQINSIQDWVLAFTAYAAVLTTANSTRAADLFEYTRLIVQAQQPYRGDAWQMYDIAFRKKAANRHLTKWADIDSALWNRAFSGKSNDSAFCRLCLDAIHATVECPLYTAGPAQRRRTGPETDSGKSVSTGTGDIAPTTPVAERMSAQQSVAAVTTATQTALSEDNHPVNPIPPPPKRSCTTSHTVHTPLKVSTLAQELHSYPNKEFVNYLINGFTFGFPIGYKGPPLSHRPT